MKKIEAHRDSQFAAETTLNYAQLHWLAPEYVYSHSIVPGGFDV